MTDLTDFMTEDRQKWTEANSVGALEGKAILSEEEDAVEAKVTANARVAYDATDLGSTGPNEDEYNYESEYKGGNAFKPDEEGGISLKNAGFKPGMSTVAGTDVGTGKQYSDQYKDESGEIKKGQEMLSEGQFNTITGATYDQTDGLFHVANGMIKEGATFDEYVDEIKGPWNHDQIGMAWHAAQTAHQTMEDIDTRGKRYYDQMRENYSQFEGIVQTIPPEGYTEETLAVDKDWIEGNRTMAEFMFGAGSTEGKTDEEISEAGKFFISQTRNNLDMTMLWANRIINENNPELARAWLALDAQYDAMDMSTESFSRAMAAQVNITNLVTFGGGVLISTLGKFAMNAGIKNSIKAVAYGAGYDAALSGAMGAGENVARQKVEITGEQREEVDPLEATFAGVIEATAGATVGFGLNAAANKTVRDYAIGKAGKAVKFMGQNMKDMGMGPMPGSPGAQRGSAGLPVTGDEKVQSSFRLQEILGGVKDGAKPITVREQIKAAVNKGLITQQEVKWSGIEDQLNYLEREGSKTSRAGLLAAVEARTPRPEMRTAARPEYMEYSLLAKAEGASVGPEDAWHKVDTAGAAAQYRERIIVLPGQDPDARFTGGHHFDAELDPEDSMIGHSRVEGSIDKNLGNGKMVLEIQSDFHKQGQSKGYMDAEGNWVGSQPIRQATPRGMGAALQRGQGEHLVDPYAEGGVAIYQDIINIANEHDIDPLAKNSIAQVWPYLSEDIKQNLGTRNPPHAPFGKDWDALGMRLEIQDSIDNGDEFIAWPSTFDQINVIEQWGDVMGEDGGAKGIVKRATTDRNKAMKKMGLEVEQIDMPQYKASMRGANIYELTETSQEVIQHPVIRAGMTQVMEEQGLSLSYVTSDGIKGEMSYDQMIDILDFQYADLAGTAGGYPPHPSGTDSSFENAAFTVKNKSGEVVFETDNIDGVHDFMWDIHDQARIKHTQELDSVYDPERADLEMVADSLPEVLRQQNMLMFPDHREGGNADDWLIMSYPAGIPPGLEENALRDAGELIETLTDDTYWDRAAEIVGAAAAARNTAINTKFNVIRLTDEVKARFKKEGMNMYGVAGVGGGAAAQAKIKEDKPVRERDEKGRFKSAGLIDDVKKGIKKRLNDRRVNKLFDGQLEYNRRKADKDRRKGS